MEIKTYKHPDYQQIPTLSYISFNCPFWAIYLTKTLFKLTHIAYFVNKNFDVSWRGIPFMSVFFV